MDEYDKCDGIDDCGDNSDEQGCGKCLAEHVFMLTGRRFLTTPSLQVYTRGLFTYTEPEISDLKPSKKDLSFSP